MLKNTALMLSGLFIAALLCEGFLRLAFNDKFGKRPRFIRADPELGWKPNSHLDNYFYGADFRITVRTDKDGYRLGKLGETDYSRELILLCGDSYVFGWGVSTDETVASHLDERIYSASNGARRVVNLGVGGYGTFQYYYRLMQFVKDHPLARIGGIIVVHSQNDAADNLKSLGYHIGSWEVKNREERERSSLHLFNFFQYAGTAIKRKLRLSDPPAGGAVTDPYLQDVLFSHEYTRTNKKYPPGVDFDGRRISFRDVSDEDWYAEKLLERRSMTRIQRELIQVAVEFIHKMAGESGIRIVHTATPTMSGWYRRELASTLAGARGSERETVSFPLLLLDPSDYPGQVMNRHGGGHYTGGFNRFWAGKIAALLGA